jgi:hypothetical protein
MMTRIFKKEGLENKMSRFEQIKAGLEASVSVRRKIETNEKQRWQSVLAQVPERRQKMAMTLLGNAKNLMTDAEIIATCNFGHAPEGDSQSAQQGLYAAGMTEAARLLDKPVPATIPEAYPATSRELQLDPALYAAGEQAARELKSFMAMSAR